MSQQNPSAFALYRYVVVITLVSGFILAVIYNSLKPLHIQNKEVAKKSAILSCIPEQKSGVDDPAAVFDRRFTVTAVRLDGKVFTKVEELNTSARMPIKYSKMADIDLGAEEKIGNEEERVYPIYTYKSDKGGNLYVLAIRGNGLWDKIWAYVALDSDLNTIKGIYFDHKGETPGLGAEIKDSEAFKKQFIDKKIFKDAEYVSVAVKKKGFKKENEAHEVHSISGATVTSDGVSEMFKRGMKNYLAYLNAMKAQKM